MAEMEPTERIPTSAASLALAVPVGRLTANAARWRELRAGPGPGTGQRRRWSARDTVVMGMLLDTTDHSGRATLAGDIRLVLAESIYEAPWGCREVTASDGTFTVSYCPRWGVGHTAAALAREPRAVASAVYAEAG